MVGVTAMALEVKAAEPLQLESFGPKAVKVTVPPRVPEPPERRAVSLIGKPTTPAAVACVFSTGLACSAVFLLLKMQVASVAVVPEATVAGAVLPVHVQSVPHPASTGAA